MPNSIFEKREHAMEATYFRQQDQRLLHALRSGAKFDEITAAMAQKLAVDKPDLLVAVRGLGITPETAGAFLLAPLIQVAWAGGSVSSKVRDAVIRSAAARGIAAGSPAHEQLLEWLKVRPPEDVFRIALDVISYGLTVLSKRERAKRAKQIVDACYQVAAASDSVAKFLGLTSAISSEEEAILSDIERALSNGSDDAATHVDS